MTHSIDHATWARRAFLVGAGLFVLGAAGEFAAHALLGGLPGWERALLFDAEVFGILIALFGPLLFGVALPLIE